MHWTVDVGMTAVNDNRGVAGYAPSNLHVPCDCIQLHVVFIWEQRLKNSPASAQNSLA